MGWSLVNQLARHHQVWVLTQKIHKSSIKQSIDVEVVDNLNFVYFDLPKVMIGLLKYQGFHQFYYFLWQIKAYFVATRLRSDYSFDLFHHITYANDWMASYVGALLPIPYIRGPGGGAHRTPKNFLKRYSFKGRMWERVRSIGQYLFRHDPFFIIGQRRSAAILVCNKESLQALPQDLKGKAYIYPVNGVSSKDLLISKNEDSLNGKFKVLTAGKLLQIKGFDLAIRAFAAFHKCHPESEFIVIGDGPEMDNLKSLCRELDICGSVIFEKWMPREDLLRQMMSGDVFLFPSLRDGGGAVVVEAMSMGTPVVCLDISGPGMHVTEGNGIKVEAVEPDKSIQDMASALAKLYLDPGLRDRLGVGARQRIEKLYHWDKIGDRLNTLYATVNSSSESAVEKPSVD